MDVTYNASTTQKQAEIVTALGRHGYRVSTQQGANVYKHPVRVWRVEPADEQKVVGMILSVDAQARPVIPPPSYTHV